MKWQFIVIVWWVFVAICVGIAELNDSTRRVRIRIGDPRQINHPLWTFIYCALCGIVFYIARDWWEMGSLLLLRISVFPVAYNLFSGNATFNLSKTTTAWSDKIMTKIGLKSTEEVNIIAFCISVILMFFQIFNK